MLKINILQRFHFEAQHFSIWAPESETDLRCLKGAFVWSASFLHLSPEVRDRPAAFKVQHLSRGVANVWCRERGWGWGRLVCWFGVKLQVCRFLNNSKHNCGSAHIEASAFAQFAHVRIRIHEHNCNFLHLVSFLYTPFPIKPPLCRFNAHLQILWFPGI